MDASIIDATEQSIQQVSNLLGLLRKNKSLRVKSQDERELIKASVWSWFKSHRVIFKPLDNEPILADTDSQYKIMLECSDKVTNRSRYIDILKVIRSNLIKFRTIAVKTIATDNPQPVLSVPNFSKLISDTRMQEILTRRWNETEICLQNGAPLAATVMMGAMLEALLLSRINRLHNKTPLFKLTCIPVDKKTGKKIPLSEWTLKNFIDAAAEMKWIREPAKQTSVIIRDYRNFIHPERELTTGININEQDMEMFWAIFVQLTKQIIDSISIK